jgi:SAM-dependent methyltransferase
MIEERLSGLIACPECSSSLTAGSDKLECTGCGRIFPVKAGIPHLLPDDVDLSHIEEEESLGELMKDHVPSGRELFSEKQWELSKEEFWSAVGRHTGSGGLTILNAGCGIDRRFLDLSRDNTLVSFDLTESLLLTLKDKHDSKHNVLGDVRKLPFAAGAFDCVCCIDLVHHEPGLVGPIIESFFRILKPGGMLFLEDLNAWALFQIWKSILMPRKMHGFLRDKYHSLKGSEHRPASYEFPTSVFKTKRLLVDAGFSGIEAIPHRAYPNTGRAGVAIYRVLSLLRPVGLYHNFHYLFYAVKP